MKVEMLDYRSDKSKTLEEAGLYHKTLGAPHRYLAYKEIMPYLRKNIKGNKALDFGAGTGVSSNFLSENGFEVIGVDIDENMLNIARQNFPDIDFYDIDSLNVVSGFDLVFSSFVLFEIPTLDDIVRYLQRAMSFLSCGGLFVGITGSNHLYSRKRNWFTFDANYPENTDLHSGDLAKLLLKDPGLTFFDYYWTEFNYFECFKRAGLNIIETYYPLGSKNDGYPWKDELRVSPFVIFVAEKNEI